MTKSNRAKPGKNAPEPGSVGDITTVKLTVSTKTRLENGDEVFICPGFERSGVPVENEVDVLADLQGKVDDFLEQALSSLPTTDLDSDDEDEDEEDEDEDDDEDEDADEEDEDLPTEAEINKMKKAELDELIEDEELDVKKSLSVKDKRAAIIEELLGDDEEDDDEEDDDEDEDEDDDEEDEAPYTKAELKKAPFEELVAIAEEDFEVTLKKSQKKENKKNKAAIIDAILEAQDDED